MRNGWIAISLFTVAMLASAAPTRGAMAFQTGIFPYGPAGPGAVLNGEFIDFVWRPGTFVLPTGSTNNILSGNFTPSTDYVYGMEVVNDRLGTLPVTSFLASNPFGRLIDSIGWIADSNLDVTANDIRFLNNVSGVDIAAAAPAAPGVPATIRYTFSNPIPDASVNSPLAPRSDVFYFTSPVGPTTVTGTWENAGPTSTQQVSGNQFAPVPEPASIVLISLGLPMFLIAAQRYKRRVAGVRLRTPGMG